MHRCNALYASTHPLFEQLGLASLLLLHLILHFGEEGHQVLTLVVSAEVLQLCICTACIRKPKRAKTFTKQLHTVVRALCRAEVQGMLQEMYCMSSASYLVLPAAMANMQIC